MIRSYNIEGTCTPNNLDTSSYDDSQNQSWPQTKVAVKYFAREEINSSNSGRSGTYDLCQYEIEYTHK